MTYLEAEPDERQSLIELRIKDNLSNPIRFLELSIKKFYTQWGDYSAAYYWLKGGKIEEAAESVNNQQKDESIYENYEKLIFEQSIFNNIDSGYYFWITFFAAVGVWNILYHKNGNLVFLILTIVTIFYITPFIIIEVQPRYRFFLMPILPLFSALGLSYGKSLMSVQFQKKT
jgi:hypothetical protein